MQTSTHRRVVLAGGRGQVGTLLARHFYANGDDVVVLRRRKSSAPWRTQEWDGVSLGDWVRELEHANVLINFAGHSVNCRYSVANRQAILNSRVLSTKILNEATRAAKAPPRIWLNSSTATIYRHSLGRPMDEVTGEIGGHEPGAPETWRFSIDVATQWEEAFFASHLPTTRRVALRSAMVMSPDGGGIFDTLLRLVRFGLGGACGNGQQFVSWIHEADFIAAIEFLLAREELTGAVNIASPNPLPNHRFMQGLRQAWGTTIGLPAREWMLEIGAFFLRTETELILKSRQVIPGRLQDAGFQFQFAMWPEAAHDLVVRWKARKSA